MAPMHQLQITLSAHLAERLAQKIASGEFPDESTAVERGLADLFDHREHDRAASPAFEMWLQREAVPAYDELETHPESGIRLEEVRASLDRRRARLSSAQ